jgi:hypothetical protein
VGKNKSGKKDYRGGKILGEERFSGRKDSRGGKILVWEYISRAANILEVQLNSGRKEQLR